MKPVFRNSITLSAILLIYASVGYSQADTLPLPAPVIKGKYSLEEVMQKRRSVRNYADEAVSLQTASQILWSAYGVTEKRDKPAHIRGGLKTAPSAGARYPLEVFLLAGNVMGLEPGLYRYIPEKHALVLVTRGDMREAAAVAARNQKMVAEAPITIVYTADFERTTSRYGDRGKNYVYVDLGHSAQNVYLQAEALNMHSCAIGAFADEEIHKVLQLPKNENVIYMMPVGKSRQ
jgi:SagB-type dehydrogenase family enzyme